MHTYSNCHARHCTTLQGNLGTEIHHSFNVKKESKGLMYTYKYKKSFIQMETNTKQLLLIDRAIQNINVKIFCREHHQSF